MISQELADILLPTAEEERKAIMAFLDSQADKSADEEEITQFLSVFRSEVVKARFTVGALDHLMFGNVTLSLDGDKLRWSASEKGRSFGSA